MRGLGQLQFCLGWKTSTISLTSHQVHVNHDLWHILFEFHLDLHSQAKRHQQINGLRKETYHQRWLMSFNPDKTEIMLFKNVENSTNFNFYFDGKLISLTSDYKHLGITFSEVSQPVSLYRYSVLVKIGSPVINLAASNCSLSNLHELETPQLSQTSHAYSNINRM
jgi:hypothetical protein